MRMKQFLAGLTAAAGVLMCTACGSRPEATGAQVTADTQTQEAADTQSGTDSQEETFSSEETGSSEETDSSAENADREGYFMRFAKRKDVMYPPIEAGVVAARLEEDEGKTLQDIQTVNDWYKVRNHLAIEDNGWVDPYSNSARRDLASIDEGFPVEYMRRVDDTTFYAVYRIEHDGMPYYMYMFFCLREGDAPTDGELWEITSWVLRASKKLSYADFKDIKAGCSMEDVSRVDPVAKVYPPTETPKFPPWLEYKTYHLLMDGILCIEYERESKEDEFTVTGTKLIENFEMPLTYPMGERKTVIQKVAPEDYPE